MKNEFKIQLGAQVVALFLIALIIGIVVSTVETLKEQRKVSEQIKTDTIRTFKFEGQTLEVNRRGEVTVK